MKKALILCQLLLAICLVNPAQALDLPSSTNVINHIIVNNLVDTGLYYELIDPEGGSHKGYIYAGTIILAFPPDLIGSYVLYYHTCGLWQWPSLTYTKMINIQRNELVVWELSPDGIKVTESSL